MVGQEGHRMGMVGVRRMLDASDLDPPLGINRGKGDARAQAIMHTGDDELMRQGDRGGVGLGTSADDEFLRLLLLCIKQGQRHRGHAAVAGLRAKGGIAGEHKRFVIGEPSIHLLVGGAPEQKTTACCVLPEVLPIIREVPWHTMASGDEAVLRHSGDEGNNHGGFVFLSCRNLRFPALLASSHADEFTFFLFDLILLQRSEALGAEAKFLLHIGVRIIGVEQFFE